MKKFIRNLLPLISLLAITACSSQTQDLPLLPELQQTNVQSVNNQQNQQPQQRVINAVFNGVVTQKLPDDTQGLKHEQFMFKISGGDYNGKVVRVAHDTTYAKYVPLKAGDQLEIKGDLLPDVRPDIVLHWTHKSDNPNHASGYIKLNGQVYD